MLPTLLIVGSILIVFALFVGYYTDWLWYNDAGYGSVFTKQLWVRALLFVVFFVLAAGMVLANAYLAYRYRPIFRAISLEQQSLDRYRLALDPFRRILLFGFSGLVGFFFGAAALAEWTTFLGWLNRRSFGAVGSKINEDRNERKTSRFIVGLVNGSVWGRAINSRTSQTGRSRTAIQSSG